MKYFITYNSLLKDHRPSHRTKECLKHIKLLLEKNIYLLPFVPFVSHAWLRSTVVPSVHFLVSFRFLYFYIQDRNTATSPLHKQLLMTTVIMIWEKTTAKKSVVILIWIKLLGEISNLIKVHRRRGLANTSFPAPNTSKGQHTCARNGSILEQP